MLRSSVFISFTHYYLLQYQQHLIEQISEIVTNGITCKAIRNTDNHNIAILHRSGNHRHTYGRVDKRI